MVMVVEEGEKVDDVVVGECGLINGVVFIFFGESCGGGGGV